MEYSAKENAQYFRQIAKAKGVKNIVFSPGSRNAPLIIELGNDPDLECITIPDERTAGFIALGQAIQSRKPSILVCTSGSALLNYYPAVAEAFYQKAPLIVASADRPTEWVDQMDGQTIRQNRVFENHILYNATLFKDGGDVQTKLHNQRVMNEAINCAKEERGPVHLNFPFAEPLYETTTEKASSKHISSFTGETILGDKEMKTLSNFWNSSYKKIILVGQLNPNNEIRKWLEKLQDGSTVIFTETIANCALPGGFNSIDRLMNLSEEQAEALRPDILLTIGHAFVSKKIKAFLRSYRPSEHWHLSIDQNHPDTFQSLTHSIKIAPEVFLKQFVELTELKKGDYHITWDKIATKRKNNHLAFIENLTYTDLAVYQNIARCLPENGQVHWANSTAIRYAQLFDYEQQITHYCNRGTSGIEGSTSTAVGFAMKTTLPTIVVTGDISFFYDSNAFFHEYLPTNLKVIVVNNKGGGIFRFIPGPDSTKHLETVFESKHHANVEGIAKAHGVPYHRIENIQDLMSKLPVFLNTFDQTEILEISTPDEASAELLKQYFNALRNG